MSFENLYDVPAPKLEDVAAAHEKLSSIARWKPTQDPRHREHNSFRCPNPFEFSDADAEEARAIGLTQSLAAAYATPAKPPRIISSFEDTHDSWTYSDFNGAEYFRGGRKLCGALVRVNGHRPCFVSATYLKALMRRNPEGTRLAAVVYAKCN